MKFKIIFLVIILLLVYRGYQHIETNKIIENSFNLDKSNYAFLSTRNEIYNVLHKSVNYEIEPKDSFVGYFAQNLFFINKDLFSLVLSDSIYYYNFKNKKLINKLDIKKSSIAINKNKKGDLIIFSGGDLYEYYFNQDKLEKLKDIAPEDFDKSIYYPSLYIHPNKITYSKKRNSVFYAAYIDFEKRIPGIYELSLDDYSLELRAKGFCPQIRDEENSLYYIKTDKDYYKTVDEAIIAKVNLDDFSEEKVLSYPHNIRDMTVIDKNTIFFVHAAADANIKGVKFDNFKVYLDGETKPIITKGNIYRSPIDVIKIEDE